MDDSREARVRRRLVRRPRVAALLHAALDARLTLLCAPAGFGKSSALADWLAEAGVEHAWLTLDRSHGDLGRFLRDVLVTLADDPSACGAPLLARPLGPLETASAILEGLDRRAGQLVLVLDDVHTVDNPAVLQVVQVLVDEGPDRLHLVLSTREDPRLNLSRLRLDGELVELRAAQLRCTTDEAGALLSHRMGVDLAPGDLTILVERTEGWPAVLQLAGLSLVDHDDPHAFVRSFAATDRLVVDFLTQEVLNLLDPLTTDFLLSTCLLDLLTGDLCDAVTGRSGGAATLDRLERANLLLTPTDDSRTWFRYHRMFADLLRTYARSLLADELPARHARAASWYLQHDRPREALEHALRAGPGSPDPALIDHSALALVHRGDLTTALALLERVPPSIIPVGAATLRAWAAALTGMPAEHVERLLAAAVVVGERSLGPTPSFSASLPSYATMLRSVLARQADDPFRAVSLAEEALRLEPWGARSAERDLLHGNGLTVLGHALLDAGHAERAITAYREALPLVQRAGNRLATAEIIRNLARLELTAGRAADAVTICRAAIGAGRSVDPCDALVLLALAEALAAQTDSRAPSVASAARELATRGGDLATMRAAEQLERLAWRSEPYGSDPAPLTGRELEVLNLVASGMTNRDIAAQLFLTVGTIKSHLHAIAVALGTSNRVAAVARARDLGLID